MFKFKDNKQEHKGGRKSSNDEVLFERRKEETKKFARGASITSIAKDNGLDWKTVKADIAEYQKFLRLLQDEGIDKDKIFLAEARDYAFERARTAANGSNCAGLMRQAIEANKEITILRGIRAVDGSVSVNSQMVMNQGEVNAYDKVDDRGLKDEFARRRSLVSSSSGKKSKGKL